VEAGGVDLNDGMAGTRERKPDAPAIHLRPDAETQRSDCYRADPPVRDDLHLRGS